MLEAMLPEHGRLGFLWLQAEAPDHDGQIACTI